MQPASTEGLFFFGVKHKDGEPKINEYNIDILRLFFYPFLIVYLGLLFSSPPGTRSFVVVWPQISDPCLDTTAFRLLIRSNLNSRNLNFTLTGGKIDSMRISNGSSKCEFFGVLISSILSDTAYHSIKPQKFSI